jgi:hypothetical protein
LGPIDRTVPISGDRGDITFRRLDSVSVFRWNILNWAQSIELVPIFGDRGDTTFRRLDSVSVFRWNLLSWIQSIELVPNSGDRDTQHFLF